MSERKISSFIDVSPYLPLSLSLSLSFNIIHFVSIMDNGMNVNIDLATKKWRVNMDTASILRVADGLPMDPKLAK